MQTCRTAVVLCLAVCAAGCMPKEPHADLSLGYQPPTPPPLSERDVECLTRAMYFESTRSSEDGLLAVGTVVMNRVESGRFPTDVCGVVGQEGQFASGVMTKPMSESHDHVKAIAERVLRGERNPKVGAAAFFHRAGLRFGYRNMRYTCVAGGNAFYEKVSRRRG